MLGEIFGLSAGLAIVLLDMLPLFFAFLLLESGFLPAENAPVMGDANADVGVATTSVVLGVVEPDAVLNGPNLGVFRAISSSIGSPAAASGRASGVSAG